MSDRWIITSHQYMEHKTLQAAEHEVKRLSKKCPDRTFTLRRVKSSVTPSPDKIALGEEINRLKVENALLNAQLDAARALVQEIADDVAASMEANKPAEAQP